LLITAACATSIPRANPDLLNFLRLGETTRQEIMLRLGRPSGSFEQERILTYRLSQDAKQGYSVTSRALPSADYSLVLIFDDQGVLQKKGLVPVH
jgi:hypothetical protein